MVRGPQMFRDDQVERLAKRLLGEKAEQRGGRRIPAADRSRAVSENYGVRSLVENLLGEVRRLVQGVAFPQAVAPRRISIGP